MFRYRIIKWIDVGLFDESKHKGDMLISLKDGVVCEGWRGEDGWHYSSAADHQDFPCDPQPTHFACMPKP
jgi:hypothetical protein